MSRESFLYRETENLFKQLEEVSQRAGVSRAVAFEDFLHVSVCALGHPLMEEEYLQTIERHKAGKEGNRSCDKMAHMFGNLVHLMTETRKDLLGDLFQGAITYGERGQFMTPEPICDMMAQMNVPNEDTGLDGRRTVNDPCCGSGRMLLSVAKLQPNWHFIGQDVDLRCVRMTAINLALRNHYGHVIHGNTLTVTNELTYETGRVQVWGNAIRKVNRVPVPDRDPESFQVKPDASLPAQQSAQSESSKPAETQPKQSRSGGGQLELF